MINKLCLVLGIVPLIILYIVKCCENRYWLTVPISMIIIMTMVLAVTISLGFFFINIGWIPEN